MISFHCVEWCCTSCRAASGYRSPVLGRYEMKFGTTLFVIVIAGAVIMGVSMFAKGAGSAWMWRGGKHDPVRRLLFRGDGSWRRFGRSAVITAIVLLLVLGYHGIA